MFEHNQGRVYKWLFFFDTSTCSGLLASNTESSL